MFKNYLLCALCVMPLTLVHAEPNNPPAANAPVAPTTAAPATPPLRQATTAAPTATNNAAAPANPLTALQQKHKVELAEQQKRLQMLEQANQTALAQNQELQLKNDNLTVQVQVLQSERSAQMFIYGAVTFAVGILMGLIIYSVLYTRRRRSW